MTWKKIDQSENQPPKKGRRMSPCISRSETLSEIAYIMMPAEMASHRRVFIYHDGGSRIALDFNEKGDFAVRQTSARSYTVRVTIPKKLAGIVPFGLRNIDIKRDADGLYIIEL